VLAVVVVTTRLDLTPSVEALAPPQPATTVAVRSADPAPSAAPSRSTARPPGADPLAAITTTSAAPASRHRAVIVGDSMAHTLAGGRVAAFPEFTPWTPEQSSFLGTSLDVVSLARPGCSFLGGEVAYVQPDGTWYTADLAGYCGSWRDDLAVQLGSSPHVDAVLVALSNDLEDRAVDGQLIRFGSAEYVALLEQFLDSIEASLPSTTRLVLVAGAPRDPAPPTDSGAWREIEMRSLLAAEASARAGVDVVDLGELVCPADDCDAPASGFPGDGRSDGLHFTVAGSRVAAVWLATRVEALL
jgi:hypothetical protein